MNLKPNVNSSRLARRLGLSDAIFLGLGSMIGAGVFSAVGPASQAAGAGLLVALVLAGLAAFINASTMAQLAVRYPESGGAYVYGRNQLGEVWGFLAGWGFVIGKIASCTAMALTFAYYAFPEFPHLAAPFAVLILMSLNNFGVKKTAGATKILLSIVLLSLLVIVVGLIAGSDLDPQRLEGGMSSGGVAGILQAAGFLFFAFAGYARLATLGEEVIDPRKTIPRAILIALALTFVVYLLVMGSALLSVPTEILANSSAPLVEAIQLTRFSQLSHFVRFGAAVAALGVLISLLAGISRTVFAMASNGELPSFLSAVHEKYKVPHRAELLVGCVVAVVVSFADIRNAIGFSSFAILIYYSIANLSALTLKVSERLYPRWLPAMGFAICLTIALSLPWASIFGGVVLFASGLFVRIFLLRNQKTI